MLGNGFETIEDCRKACTNASGALWNTTEFKEHSKLMKALLDSQLAGFSFREPILLKSRRIDDHQMNGAPKDIPCPGATSILGHCVRQ